MIAQLAPSSSVGLSRYAHRLAAAMRGLGVESERRDVPSRGVHGHYHLGNSTRSLLPRLPFAERSVVTLHDVVPRSERLRPLLAPVQRRILERHLVVLHSRHGEEMLRSLGFRGETHVVHLAAVDPVDVEAAASLRASLPLPEGRPLLAVAGLMRAHKGAAEVLRLAGDFPSVSFLFAGRVADEEMRSALEAAPENVAFLDSPSDEDFLLALASADALLHLRGASVGEASGPVVEAHACGTPVVGYATGFMPEYSAEQDVLFPPGTPPADVVAAFAERVARGGVRRVPSDSSAVTRMEDAAKAYLDLYATIGWLT